MGFYYQVVTTLSTEQQTNGQYLKFDKTFACSSVRKLRTQKRAFILLLALQQMFSIRLSKFKFLSSNS